MGIHRLLVGFLGVSRSSAEASHMPQPLALTISEDQFLRKVIAYAQLRKWKVHHSRPAVMRSGKWATPLIGDKGLPDLVLARDGVIIMAELKSQRGKPSPEQLDWLEHIGDAGRLWKPEDWPEIIDELR